MSTAILGKSYKDIKLDFITTIKEEFLLLPKPDLATTNDYHKMESYQKYWNSLIQKAQEWQQAVEQIHEEGLVKQLKNFIKRHVIGKCTVVLKSMNREHLTQWQAKSKRKQLATEMRDRLLYMKLHY